MGYKFRALFVEQNPIQYNVESNLRYDDFKLPFCHIFLPILGES